MEPSPAGEPVVRFRAGKKRKAYRHRTDDDQATAGPETQSQADSGDAPAKAETGNDGGDDEEVGVAAALRLRNARRARLNGVGFSTKQDDDNSGERALVLRDADGAQNNEVGPATVGDRFTHQTGLVADLNDKHMMEYIESRLSGRASGTKPESRSEPATATGTGTGPTTSANADATASSKKPIGGHSAMQGQIMEIDLGDEARDYNVARTERATQYGGSPAPAEDNGSTRRAKKPRLGRDGKPWRPRNRRDSDAIKRDQLVEEILRESRLDVYEAPAQQSNPPGGDEDGAADDRLAEEFRQQFLEDVAARQLKKKKLATQPAKPGAEEVLKGPKLGGSRNSRAAMRDLLLKKEREGKK